MRLLSCEFYQSIDDGRHGYCTTNQFTKGGIGINDTGRRPQANNRPPRTPTYPKVVRIQQ